MNIDAMLAAMTPDVYERLRQAAETGKWPDGTPLNDEQKETTLHAVMLYQAKVARSTEHMTINADGEIVHKRKQDFKKELAQPEDDGSTIARFKQDDI